MPKGPSSHSARFGELISEAAKRRGLSTGEVEERAGVACSTVSQWLLGSADGFDAADVRAVCHVLEVDPRQAAVALGFLTREEVFGHHGGELPAPAEEVVHFLQDASVSEAEKDQLVDYMRYLCDRARGRPRSAGPESGTRRPARPA